MHPVNFKFFFLILSAIVSTCIVASGQIIPENIKKYNLAIKLLNENPKNSVKILKSLTEVGDPNGMCLLAELYLEGTGVEKSHVNAIELLERAAKHNFAPAINNLGWLHDKGRGFKQDSTNAHNYYLKSAKLGFEAAQYNLANAYHHGRGVARDLIEATHWYRKAAIQGNKDSQFVLGKLYALKQPKESFHWMRKAADNGHVMAQCETAKVYLSGIGAPQNPTLAFNYFQLAAKQDHPEGTFLLGKIFYEGYGTVRNQQKGITLIKKSGSLGSKSAPELLPKLLVKRFNILTSLQKASEGDINSILDLGWNYFKGTSIGQNNIEAYAWFNLAAEFTGDKKDIWARSFVAKRLDVNELIEAKKRATQISELYNIKKPVRK